MSSLDPRRFALVVTALLVGCHRPPSADPRTEPPLVRSAVAHASTGTSTRKFTGVVAARVQSDLGFRVGGKVVQRLVSAGERIQRGRPLMRLDGSDLKLALDAQEEAVVAASARARQATDDEARDRNLVRDGAEPAATYDRMRASAEAARAQHRAVEAQALVARNAMGYSLLVADADGVVVETLAEPGQVVAAGQAVVRIAHDGPREALVQLPETLRPALGSVAMASLYGRASEIVPTKLRELSSSADPLTRTFQARYVLEGPLAAATLGATVDVTVPQGSGGRELRVPLGAVLDRGDGPGVWNIKGEPAQVSWRSVKVARIEDESATISEGLAEGDRVVALGAHVLREGQEVRLQASAAAPGQNGARP